MEKNRIAYGAKPLSYLPYWGYDKGSSLSHSPPGKKNESSIENKRK